LASQCIEFRIGH